MPTPDALQQPIELDLFEGPFDLLLTLVLREEVDLLELPLLEVVTAALGERARERWDTDTAGELIVLLAAMAELKARRLLGEAPTRSPTRTPSRRASAWRPASWPTRPSSAPAGWLAERQRASAGPRYRRIPLEGAAAAAGAGGAARAPGGGDRRPARRAAARPRWRTSPTAG